MACRGLLPLAAFESPVIVGARLLVGASDKTNQHRQPPAQEISGWPQFSPSKYGKIPPKKHNNTKQTKPKETKNGKRTTRSHGSLLPPPLVVFSLFTSRSSQKLCSSETIGAPRGRCRRRRHRRHECRCLQGDPASRNPRPALHLQGSHHSAAAQR